MKLKKILLLAAVSLFPFFSTAFGGDRTVNGSYNHLTTYYDNRDNRCRHRQHRPRIIKERYRDYYRNGKTCRKTTTVIREHGIRKRIVSTECWDNDRHMYPTRHRFSHRNDHYSYRNRGHRRNHYRNYYRF